MTVRSWWTDNKCFLSFNVYFTMSHMLHVHTGFIYLTCFVQRSALGGSYNLKLKGCFLYVLCEFSLNTSLLLTVWLTKHTIKQVILVSVVYTWCRSRHFNDGCKKTFLYSCCFDKFIPQLNYQKIDAKETAVFYSNPLQKETFGVNDLNRAQVGCFVAFCSQIRGFFCVYNR